MMMIPAIYYCQSVRLSRTHSKVVSFVSIIFESVISTKYAIVVQVVIIKPFVQLKDKQKLHVAWLKEATRSGHLPSEVQASPITTPGGVWSYILSVLNNGLPTYSWRLSVVTSTAPSAPCTILRAALRNIYERKHEMEFGRESTLVCFLACTAGTKTAGGGEGGGGVEKCEQEKEMEYLPSPPTSSSLFSFLTIPCYLMARTKTSPKFPHSFRSLGFCILPFLYVFVDSGLHFPGNMIWWVVRVKDLVSSLVPLLSPHSFLLVE